MGYIDSVYDVKLSGTHPSGWECDDLPKLLEFDNYFNNLTQMGSFFPWGTDEITWFSNQTESGRNEFLKYAWGWLWKYVDHAYLAMPGRRPTRVPVYETENAVMLYYCNDKSKLCPTGFNQEDTIKKIWSDSRYQNNSARSIVSLKDGETEPGVKIPQTFDEMSIERIKALYMVHGGFATEVDRKKGREVLLQIDKGVKVNTIPCNTEAEEEAMKLRM